MSSVNAWMYYCIIGPALFRPFIFVRTLLLDFIWAHWGSIMALRQLYMQHIPLCVLLKWVGSPARLPWTIFKLFQHKTDVSQQVLAANAAHTFSTWTRGCFFHPEMWTGHMSGWADLLRTGKQQRRRHLLQAAPGQDVLQHRNGHPETFRGPDHASALRRGILCSSSIVLQVETALPATPWTPICDHVTGAAGWKQWAWCGPCHPAALVWRSQTPANVRRDDAGSDRSSRRTEWDIGWMKWSSHLTTQEFGWLILCFVTVQCSRKQTCIGFSFPAASMILQCSQRATDGPINCDGCFRGWVHLLGALCLKLIIH